MSVITEKIDEKLDNYLNSILPNDTVKFIYDLSDDMIETINTVYNSNYSIANPRNYIREFLQFLNHELSICVPHSCYKEGCTDFIRFLPAWNNTKLMLKEFVKLWCMEKISNIKIPIYCCKHYNEAIENELIDIICDLDDNNELLTKFSLITGYNLLKGYCISYFLSKNIFINNKDLNALIQKAFYQRHIRGK